MGEGIDEEKRSTLRRFAAVGAAAPLARFANLDTGESQVRDAIAGYLSTTPGAHFSKLRDDLHLGTGEAQHHVRHLQRANAVESYRDGDYRRFFPAGQFTAFEKVALSYLRRGTPRGMIIALLREPEASGRDLAAELGVSAATVSKYAAELESAGLLDRTDGYRLERPEALIALVLRYADSFDENAADFAANAADLITYDP